MASGRNRERLIKQWTLLETIRPFKRGLTARDICDRTGIKKATFHRYLRDLRDAGIPLQSETINGEVRHSLWGHELPPLGPSVLQIAALRLARRALIGLDGTRAAVELDKLLDGYARAGSNTTEAVSIARPRINDPKLLNKLDHAIHAQRRTRILYRSAQATAPAWRVVDPLGIRFVGGHVYFVAHDDQRARPVTFKLDRISQVVLLTDKAGAHPKADLEQLFASSVKTWIGPSIEVTVRLSPAVARFSREYPLVAGQSVHEEPDGALIVRGKVAGIPETMRWVLRWGMEAEALEPMALREAVAAEVRGAAGRYEAGRAKRGVGRSPRAVRAQEAE